MSSFKLVINEDVCVSNSTVLSLYTTAMTFASPYKLASVFLCLHMYMWFIMYACKGSGNSQKEGDQTPVHKTSLVHRSSLLWDPICPIKKLLLADASSELFYVGAPGAKETCVFMHWKEGVTSTWQWRPTGSICRFAQECLIISS